MNMSISSYYYYNAVCTLFLLQFWGASCAECDNYYILFKEIETKMTTELSQKKITLLSMSEEKFTWNDITALNNSIREECVLSLSSCAPETYCHVHKLTPKEEQIIEDVLTFSSTTIGTIATKEQSVTTMTDGTLEEESGKNLAPKIDDTTINDDLPVSPSTDQLNTMPHDIWKDENADFLTPNIEDTTNDDPGWVFSTTTSTAMTDQLKMTNETLKAEKDKMAIIICSSVFAGSLGSAAGIYFVARKIQGLLQSNTYQLPA